jgi:hypothetical protein
MYSLADHPLHMLFQPGIIHLTIVRERRNQRHVYAWKSSHVFLLVRPADKSAGYICKARLRGLATH